MLKEFGMIFILFLNPMESNEIHRILWNAMKIYRIQRNAMKWIEYYSIQSISHDVVFIDIDFDACQDYRKPPAGPPGAPREHSEAIWQYLTKSLKKYKIASMPLSNRFE